MDWEFGRIFLVNRSRIWGKINLFTENLTNPISKKLLAGMLCVTIGAELVLFLCRYRYFFSIIYDSIMVAAFFVGWRLYWKPRPQHCKEHLQKRKKILQFTKITIIFFFGSFLLNTYSAIVFGDFTTSSATPSIETFEKFHIVGYDFYIDILSGMEEVSRYAYIVLFLFLFKKIFPKKWEQGTKAPFLIAALFLSSFLFGIDHTLDTGHNWENTIGIVVHYTNMGLFLGILLLWTKSLWSMVSIHVLYNITASLSWYYNKNGLVLVLFLAIIVYIAITFWGKRNQSTLKMEGSR
jgi:membrane protease YdiL (CAAX protease family)